MDGHRRGQIRAWDNPGFLGQGRIGDHMGTLGAILLAMLALIVVASFVIAVRRNPSWPRRPHLGHWRKWDDDD